MNKKIKNILFLLLIIFLSVSLRSCTSGLSDSGALVANINRLQQKEIDELHPELYYDDPLMLKLLHAIDDRDNETLKQAIAEGADINKEGVNKVDPEKWVDDDMYPIEYAHKRRNYEAIRILMSAGADLSLMYKLDDVYEEAPLYTEFIYRNNPELLKYSIPYMDKDELSELLYNYAFRKDQDSRACMQLLLDAGADINHASNFAHFGDNYSYPLLEAASKSKWDHAYFLLENGADYHKKNSYGSAITYYIANKSVWKDQREYFNKTVKFLQDRNVTLYLRCQENYLVYCYSSDAREDGNVDPNTYDESKAQTYEYYKRAYPDIY